jgi:hypothetical protein
MTNDSGATKFIMQFDGNLVIYNAAGVAVWNSYTYGHDGQGAFLRLQDDGNLVIYFPNGSVLWESESSATESPKPPAGRRWQ